MTKKQLIIFMNIVISCAAFLLGLCISARAHAQVPSLPYQIYGKILSEHGAPVANGQISAYIAGNLVGTSKTNELGEYGIAPQTLIISDPLGQFSGKNIEFTLNGLPIQETAQFRSGVLEEEDWVIPGIRERESAVNATKFTLPSSNVSTTAASTSSLKGENEIITYTTPIFHIKKHARLSQYVPAHPPLYPHSKILGIIAGCTTSLMFFWVCLQNYLHAKRHNL
jgi:hypothetical protein